MAGKTKKQGMESQPQSHQGPFDKRQPIRVSLGVYVVSLLVLGLIVFIAMLVQYLPGYRNSYRISQAIKKSEVSMRIVIPMSEVRQRKTNPFTDEQEKQIEDTLIDMGAREVVENNKRLYPRVEIEPEVEKKGTSE